MKPAGVIESCLYAADLEAAEIFYSKVLQLEVIVREAGRHVFFRCGESVVLVFDPAHTSKELTTIIGSSIPLHGATGPGHIAFRIEEKDLEKWRAQLKDAGVAIESDVSWPNGGRSIYFRDPAGNSIELTTPKLWEIT
jgi:catechol 2,3-dioxygenase-like lactoylglutathione lyase family enzyme